MKIAIIEDERPAAQRLERLMHAIRPQVEIIGMADSIDDACELLVNPAIELAFLDIQLADGISFSIFDRIPVQAPVIFTTAHDEYALRAFKVNSIDYLLKPIEPGALLDAILKFEQHRLPIHRQYNNAFESLVAQRKDYRKRFLIKSGHQLSFVTADQVAWFFSEAGTTFLVTTQNDRFILASTLDDLEVELDPTAFFRINRGCIVALNAIQKIEPHLNHRLLLHLHPNANDQSMVSRQRVTEFKQWLDGK
jgi:DNA-binding LytR/AlgR family response regulator